MYATAPSGVLLASANSNNPGKIAEMLRKALEAWANLPRSERLLADDPQSMAEEVQRVRAERWYPDGGLALRIHTRDLPRLDGSDPAPPGDWRARALNRDFAWFTPDEARQFIPEVPSPGQSRSVPELLIQRLSRLHFVDNVRGQTSPYRPHEVETAQLKSTITAADGPRVTLHLEGRVRLSAEGVWPIDDRHDAQNPKLRSRGFDAGMLGYAVWDTGRQQFTAFDLLAVGDRWGGTQYNRRDDDLAPAPMGIALTLAANTPADRVAPAAFWGYGWK
ncbi:MAG TPA: hypothetical protein VFJ58_25030 [Armatimonadota bacterium]|nr:hypothetical protein [Armatimonadota bacterium]